MTTNTVIIYSTIKTAAAIILLVSESGETYYKGKRFDRDQLFSNILQVLKMALMARKTLLILMTGILIGLIFSPIMWLQFYSPDPVIYNLNRLNPRCSDISAISVTKRTPSVSGNTGNVTETPPETNNIKHNRTKLSKLDLERSIAAPGNPNVRQRRLTDELATRKLLFVGVITAQKYLDTRALGIWRTWGRDISDLFFFASQPDEQGLDLPIITLPGINDTQYPPQRKVYRMLKYMHDHYINEYDFFMRSDDDVYVKSDLLLELLQKVNPAQDIYMGCPGFGRPDDQARIKLNENEHYCMGGPGVIFSRSALRKLAPHLETCLEVSIVYCIVCIVYLCLFVVPVSVCVVSTHTYICTRHMHTHTYTHTHTVSCS